MLDAFLRKLDTHGQRAASWSAVCGLVGIVAFALITIIDVLLRWLFNSPISGLNEVIGLGIGVAVAATFPAGAAQRVNLTIDLLGSVINAKVLAWLKVFASLLLLLFYSVLAWRIGEYALKLQERSAETVFVHLPMAPFMWVIAVFLGAAALVQLMALLVTLKYALAGVPDPSQVERVKAFVVLKGAAPANADTERALIEHCRERLIKWSCPREIEFRSELPKTKIGKIDYKDLVRQQA